MRSSRAIFRSASSRQTDPFSAGGVASDRAPDPAPRSGARLKAGALALLAAGLVSAGCTEKRPPPDAAPDADAAVQGPLDAGEEVPRSPTSYAGALDDTAMPAPDGEDLDKRMRHLLEALTQNDADLAADMLFPRDAYGQVRDSTDPQRAWDVHVQGNYRRAIDRMHKRTKGIERARFVSFEIGPNVAQIVPRKNDFNKPLWRVRHSRLSFAIDGRVRHLDIAEMTAWRGAWYVTRLR